MFLDLQQMVKGGPYGDRTVITWKIGQKSHATFVIKTVGERLGVWLVFQSPDKMLKIGFFAALVLMAFFPFSNALYFHIAETERKCFIEEIPDETMVVGKYIFL